MADQIVSLAYYASRAKRKGVDAADLMSGGDYHDLLPKRIDYAAERELWQEMFNSDDDLVPLSDIDLMQADFLDIVDQIYRGVPFREVHLAVGIASLVQQTHPSYFQRYLQTIPDDTRTPSAVNATLNRVHEIIDNNPAATGRCNGLVVGRVQSGKTRNYIGLMLKAADDGWNVIIVLTSAIKTLAKQTRNRIYGEFGRVGTNDARYSRELDFLSANGANRLAGDELNGDFMYWGVAMKQVDGLNRVKDWLEIPGQPLSSMRVMIIDDESDNATPDSVNQTVGNLNDDEITERIGAIEKAPGCTSLALWFSSLRVREWPDIGAKTDEARTFESLCALLGSNKSKKDIRDQIVNTAEYRRFLGMEDYSDPPVETLVKQFFTKARGDGDDTCGAFVLLLKSILAIVRGRSAINAALCALVGPNPETDAYAYPFSRCAYLGYTATPYANILNEGPGQTPIYPDFIQSLEISPQYFGTDAIFGHDIALTDPKMPIVCPITEDEERRILGPLREGGVSIDADLLCHDDEGDLEWRSLKESIAWGFCTAAARKLLREGMADGEKRERIEHRWTTQLVNIDHRMGSHDFVKNAVEAFVAGVCATQESRAAFADYCHGIWQCQTAQFPAGEFERIFNTSDNPAERYGGVADYPAWEEVLPHLQWYLEQYRRHVHPIVMNSSPEGVDSQNLYSQDSDAEVQQLEGDHFWIVSGGNTIGRGLTLHGLTVSYFDRVRSSTCVDTLTQMGRWFGYRPGYELLPRLWMNRNSIVEMKRIARLELRLHESIADNFAQKFSPADPAHFQQILCWGRRLSGRAYATRTLDTGLGTTASVDDYYTAADMRRHAFDLASGFVQRLGPETARNPDEYLYAATPLWENVDRAAVRVFLESLLPFYPDRSRKILRGMVREINGSEPISWDVVVGHPGRGDESREIPFGGGTARYGVPKAVPLGNGDVRTESARLHLSFYAMIRSEHLYRQDVELLRAHRATVAAAIDRLRIQRGGQLPPQYEQALPGSTNETVYQRLDRLIADLEQADGTKPLPEAVHARLGDQSQGLRNRSSAEYMAKVHRRANHSRPVLQIYLIRPDGLRDDAAPLVNLSFYWPDHDPDLFFNVSVEETPDTPVMATPRTFCQTVEDILREYDFPMQRKVLLCKVLDRLGPRCTPSFFDQHIKNPLEGYTYHKMERRNAYCIDGWATDEEKRLSLEFLQAAIAVLQRDCHPYQTADLIRQVVDEQPRFRDFFVPGNDNTAVNNLMTDDILNANDITVKSRRPVTYQYAN